MARDYGKAGLTSGGTGYAKSVKEGPTKSHSKPSPAFARGGPARKPKVAAKSDGTTENNGGSYANPGDPIQTDNNGMGGLGLPPGGGVYDGMGWGNATQDQTMGPGSNFGANLPSYTGTNQRYGPNQVFATGADNFLPQPQPRPGMGGPLGPPVTTTVQRQGVPQVAHAKVTAPGYSPAAPGASMGAGYNGPMSDAGYGNVADPNNYGGFAGHGYGTHDYGVGAQMTGFTGGDNFGFTDFSGNSPSGGGSSGGGGGSTSGGGFGGGGGGFGGADQESKG